MTAISLFVTDERAHLFTDGAWIRADTGELAHVSSKVIIDAGLPAVLTARGPDHVLPFMTQALVRGAFSSFDAMADGAIHTLRNLPPEFEATAIATGSPMFHRTEFVMVGWSERAQAVRGFAFRSFDMPGDIPAWEQAEVCSFHAPHPPGALPEPNEVTAADGLRIVEAQRRIREAYGSAGPVSGVGGYCQHTTLTRDGITTRILERWPDKIGEKIAA